MGPKDTALAQARTGARTSLLSLVCSPSRPLAAREQSARRMSRVPARLCRVWRVSGCWSSLAGAAASCCHRKLGELSRACMALRRLCSECKQLLMSRGSRSRRRAVGSRSSILRCSTLHAPPTCPAFRRPTCPPWCWRGRNRGLCSYAGRESSWRAESGAEKAQGSRPCAVVSAVHLVKSSTGGRAEWTVVHSIALPDGRERGCGALTASSVKARILDRRGLRRCARPGGLRRTSGPVTGQ